MHIYDFLLKLGIKPAQKGFDYIVSLISMTGGSRNYGVFIMYGEVAKIYNVTYVSVERCIRHAITSALNKAKGDTLKMWITYFGESIEDGSIYVKEFCKKLNFLVDTGVVYLDDVVRDKV